MLNTRRPLDFLIIIIFLQFAVYVTVFLNIPVARQVVGFVYFTFIPGLIVLKLLKFDKLDRVESLLLAVGFSVAFLMFGGLLLNEFGLLFGLSTPLSLMPLMIVLNSFILIGAVVVYLRGEGLEHLETKIFGLRPLTLALAILPILSIVGAMYVNVFENNFILLFTIIAIALLFVVGVASRKPSSSYFYPLAVLMIAISLLFSSSFISKYIFPFGSDIPVEYYVFKTTQNSGHWISTNPYFGDISYGRLNAMLSVTILPTVYSNTLNIDATWTFKILFPLLFSLVPLCLYQVWQNYFGKKYAFAAAFLFMAESTFYTEMLGLNRQMIAELFFVLLLLVLLKKEISPLNKAICFIIFSAALVASHYALAEIFLFFIFFAIIALFLMKRPGRNMTASMAVLFFVIMFSWYIFTSSSSVFSSFLSFGSNVYSQLGNFFNPSSRGQTVLSGLGATAAPSILNAISRAFAYITEALIVVGFLALIAKRAKVRIEREYLIMCVAAMALLGLLILVPGLANTLDITRFYHILLFFLAPLCIIGADFLIKLVSKRKEELLVSILLLMVLVPYFLFQTGLIYEVTGSVSFSVSLSGYRMNPLQLYGNFGDINAYSAFGAIWLSKNVNTENTEIYCDVPSLYTVLTSYGMTYRGFMEPVSNSTVLAPGDVLYLGYLSVFYGEVVGNNVWNFSEMQPVLSKTNIVYSNGGSEIYISTG
jgi:uncharacterized membrane protein